MKLHYSVTTCSELFGKPEQTGTDEYIERVSTDSRKITEGKHTLFVALSTAKRSGADFVSAVYSAGVRLFLVGKNDVLPRLEDATIWRVEEPLFALQELAKFHRSRFHYPVVIITGSLGKTTFKEWAFHCLSPYFTVVRSPKSFNSQLGVALSLLELHEDAQIALIEAGISEPGEMKRLEEIIAPTLGVFTHYGAAHREHFPDAVTHLNEKLQAFIHCQRCFVSEATLPTVLNLPPNFQVVPAAESDAMNNMRLLLKAFLKFLQLNDEQIANGVAQLPTLALRMETFEGNNGNIIINDTYNLDSEALREALHAQKAMAGTKKRIVVLGVSADREHEKEGLQAIVNTFSPDQLLFINEGEDIPWDTFSNAVVLVKAHRDRRFERQISLGKAIQHRTRIEINLSAIAHNIQFFKRHLHAHTQVLCMVKADAYGTGAVRVAAFLEQLGVNALGVAFADEGATLRKNGIGLPIVVMNPDPEHIDLMLNYQLQPAVYSFQQMDQLVRALIDREAQGLLVHLKFDTGMHRLGFAPEDAPAVLSSLQAQPELKVAGIYSHLADADNAEQAAFTQQQLARFDGLVQYFRKHLSDSFTAHILNSEGALRYADQAYDMVRLGISMYGYTDNQQLKRELRPAVSWYSTVSQIKTIPAGDSIGYGCTFTAEEDMRIAIVPVGYADGFRRSLSNGVGAVWINGSECKVVGRVCMDMIMVAVPNHIHEGDTVEIIGEHLSMERFAARLNTIPYEVMTIFSQRMARTYVVE